MRVLIDVGNTNIKIAIVENNIIKRDYLLKSVKDRLADEYAPRFASLIQEPITDVVIASVVPEIQSSLVTYFTKYHQVMPLVIGKGVKTGLDIKTTDPKQVGADLVAAGVGALNYADDAIVIDMGTAIKFLHIKNRVLVGVSIAPGLSTSLNGLVLNTALLPEVQLEQPDKIMCRETIECMQSGAVYGFASLIDGMIYRIKKEVRNDDILVICTGGDFNAIKNVIFSKVNHVKDLIIEGLNVVCDKNIDKGYVK